MRQSGLTVIALAIIWTAVILGSIFVLKNTPYYGKMLLILGGGAAASILIVGGTIRRK